MCVSSPSAPTPPPPPPPPPEPPKRTDPSVKQAKANQRSVAARSAGRQSTLLGGQLTSDAANQPNKTLLGQ
jgi:hypothetical protein